MRRRGFVILELLAVIAVIGILAAILLPALARMREAGRCHSCMANLAQLGLALRMYADECDRYLPWSGGDNDASCLGWLVGDYVQDTDLFRCPSDSMSTPESLADIQYKYDVEEDNRLDETVTCLDATYGLRTSYDYFGAYTKAPLRYPHPSRPTPKLPLMWDLTIVRNTWPGGFGQYFNHVPGGGNVLWMDGSVTFELIEDWAGENLPYRPSGIDFIAPEDVDYRYEVEPIPPGQPQMSSERQPRMQGSPSPPRSR